jgi:hypothetical protein
VSAQRASACACSDPVQDEDLSTEEIFCTLESICAEYEQCVFTGPIQILSAAFWGKVES